MSNIERFAAAPLADGGTHPDVWIRAVERLPRLDLAACPGIVVVAAHPDDETLGFGATAATLAAAGRAVRVVAVSDGGAAIPGLSARERSRLEGRRRVELTCAMDVLGLPPPVCVGLPDGELAAHETRLAGLLAEQLADRPTGTWCAATWRGDGHPDHEAVGRAAATAAAATGAVLVEYPVWMWHWASPPDPAVPWRRAAAVPLTASAVERKARAARRFRSQLDGPDAVVPPDALRRLLAVGEVVFR